MPPLVSMLNKTSKTIFMILAVFWSVIHAERVMAIVIPPPLQPPTLGFRIDTVSVSPQSLSIPCSLNPFRSCPGFRGTRDFTASVGYTASYDGGQIFPSDKLSMEVKDFNVALLEDDLIVDNIVGLFSGMTTFSKTFTGIDSGTFSFGFTVNSSQLNGQCPRGCNSRFGYSAEGFALEFLIDPTSYVDVVFNPFGFGVSWEGRIPLKSGSLITLNDLHRVPEPSSLYLLTIGIFVQLMSLLRKSGQVDRTVANSKTLLNGIA